MKACQRCRVIRSTLRQPLQELDVLTRILPLGGYDQVVRDEQALTHHLVVGPQEGLAVGQRYECPVKDDIG